MERKITPCGQATFYGGDCNEEDHLVQVHHVSRKVYNFWGTIEVTYGEGADVEAVVQAVADMDEKLRHMLA